MTQSRQAQQKSLQDLRRSLKFEDVGQVESRVQELEAMIEQGQCANLREEKALMQEIKQLNATKAVIVQYQSQKAGQSDDSETKVTPRHRAARAPRRVRPRAPAPCVGPAWGGFCPPFFGPAKV
jgi:flagellar biosynthesis/type III secretory pathway chaperone